MFLDRKNLRMLEKLGRREFLAGSAAAASAMAADEPRQLPKYRIVSPYKSAAKPGMPGPYPGRVITVHSPKCIDENTEQVDAPTVQEMMRRGMMSLTGDKDFRDSWARFFNREDVVGIKINSSGAPGAMSMPQIVAEIAVRLIDIGVRPSNVIVHERTGGQMAECGYEKFVPAGVRVESAPTFLGFDNKVYVECNFFGEEDTRSYMLRMTSEKFTKIINVPNMKDHGASGVTGCLKNVAYGEFNNVARSHYKTKTETLSFIGTLTNVEPLRSKTVLQIMDGLRGVWHAGPFSTERRYRFYPKQMKFGTDPVAMDRLLIDIIDNKRKQEGAISVWERDLKYYSPNLRDWQANPNVNRFIREPGHIEFASKLGLGVYDLAAIRHQEITV